MNAHVRTGVLVTAMLILGVGGVVVTWTLRNGPSQSRNTSTVIERLVLPADETIIWTCGEQSSRVSVAFAFDSGQLTLWNADTRRGDEILFPRVTVRLGGGQFIEPQEEFQGTMLIGGEEHPVIHRYFLPDQLPLFVSAASVSIWTQRSEGERQVRELSELEWQDLQSLIYRILNGADSSDFVSDKYLIPAS